MRGSNAVAAAFLACAALLLQGCAASPALPADETPLAPIRVAGARWIELSPVLVAASHFYPVKLEVPAGGVVSITSGAADLATNAETQLLRESVTNPDLRIIMTVSESFYRLVARRSSGISRLSDLKGKRVLVPRQTSAQYYLVAMLRSAGLKEEDVTLVSLPPVQAPAGQPAPVASKFRMAEALARGEADVMATFEPEPAMAMDLLGSDAVMLQDRSVYREAFNLNARARDLADPAKRRAIVAFVRAVADASEALKKNPAPYLPGISSVIGFSVEQIGRGWPETEFPVHIIPDMLDVLEVEEQWLARTANRAPRSRAELAKFIDRSVVEEALKSR
ncbi:MAG: ABC transporter substrate-binding protein [Proteobacteria bacterium]|jgi:sulfonate transport system substrate-binding protein|nr:ABC transporter substrate-binding protein [Pseudomonadota bacterium]MBK7117082.1 ABC transporter substrate-binding protein [Pseudomonadota bacterium]